MSSDKAVRLVVGASIDVHTQYDDSWCAGFQVVEVLPGGYRVQRTHDRLLLPAMTSTDDVRPSSQVSPWI